MRKQLTFLEINFIRNFNQWYRDHQSYSCELRVAYTHDELEFWHFADKSSLH